MSVVNDSSTGGYLQPFGPAPLEDQALFRFVQQWFVGILSEAVIPGSNFFPRWQLEPPNYPGPTVDWAAFGIEVTPAQLFPVVRHFDASGTQPAYDQYEIHEWLDILVSLYGPNANRNARTLRDGMYIAQNRTPLYANDMYLTETGELRTLPALVKERYQYRVDFRVKLRRRIVRHYAILNLEWANVTVNNESYTSLIVTERPTGHVQRGEGADVVAALGSVH